VQNSKSNSIVCLFNFTSRIKNRCDSFRLIALRAKKTLKKKKQFYNKQLKTTTKQQELIKTNERTKKYSISIICLFCYYS